jgi:hypothetical protein
MAHASAVLPERQDGASTVPAVVRTRRTARDPDAGGNTLRDGGESDERERVIDATVASAKGGGEEIGKTRRGTDMKILAIVDRHGLPLSVSPHAANHHTVTRVPLSCNFSMQEAKPQNLIGERAYDRGALDDELKKDRVEIISPHRST